MFFFDIRILITPLVSSNSSPVTVVRMPFDIIVGMILYLTIYVWNIMQNLFVITACRKFDIISFCESK